MLRVQRWDGKSPINGISAEIVLESRKDIASNLNDVFLVINEYDIVTEIQFGKTIAANNNIDPGKSLKEIANEYLIIKQRKAEEEENIVKEKVKLEEQTMKIDLLQAEKEKLLKITKDQDKLLVDNAYKIAILEMNMGGM